MPELGPFGSVRGVCSNAHPYRDMDRRKFIRAVAQAPSDSHTLLQGEFLALYCLQPWVERRAGVFRVSVFGSGR